MTDLGATQIQDSTLGSQSSKFEKSSHLQLPYPRRPDTGTYVIRTGMSGANLVTVHDGRYLSWRRGQKFADMTNLADATLWTVKKDTNSDNEQGPYTISADGLRLGVVPPSAEDRDHRLPGEPENGPSHTRWMLGVGYTGNTIEGLGQFQDLTVDLTKEDRVILWEKNTHLNQAWTIYPYFFNTPRIETGTYCIRFGSSSAAKCLALQLGTEVILKDLDLNDASQRWRVEVTVQEYRFRITNEDGDIILSTVKTPSGGRVPHGGLGDEEEPKWEIRGLEDTGLYRVLDAWPHPNRPTLLNVVNNEVVISDRLWKDETFWGFEKL